VWGKVGLVEALCPRAIILDGGEVIADGDTSQILADKHLLAAHGLARHKPMG
jgi:ABC-type branched-subunit amino acid transport system ATPase component